MTIFITGICRTHFLSDSDLEWTPLTFKLPSAPDSQRNADTLCERVPIEKESREIWIKAPMRTRSPTGDPASENVTLSAWESTGAKGSSNIRDVHFNSDSDQKCVRQIVSVIQCEIFEVFEI